MKLTPYPNCCGKTILQGFGNGPGDRNYDAQADGVHETLLQAFERFTRGRGQDREYEAALNGAQNAAWSAIMVAAGWRLVATHYNPVHASTIYTYYIGRELVLFGDNPQPEITMEQRRELEQIRGQAQAAEVVRQAELERRAEEVRRREEERLQQQRLPMSYNIADYVIGHQLLRGDRVAAGDFVQVNDVNVITNGQIGQVVYSGGGLVEVRTQTGTRPYYTYRLRTLTRRELNAPAAPPVPAAPAPIVPAVIGQEFYANLRNIGRRGPFVALEDATAAYPRCRNFERRDIYNDGTSQWVAVDRADVDEALAA